MSRALRPGRRRHRVSLLDASEYTFGRSWTFRIVSFAASSMELFLPATSQIDQAPVDPLNHRIFRDTLRILLWTPVQRSNQSSWSYMMIDVVKLIDTDVHTWCRGLRDKLNFSYTSLVSSTIFSIALKPFLDIVTSPTDANLWVMQVRIYDPQVTPVKSVKLIIWSIWSFLGPDRVPLFRFFSVIVGQVIQRLLREVQSAKRLGADAGSRLSNVSPLAVVQVVQILLLNP